MPPNRNEFYWSEPTCNRKLKFNFALSFLFVLSHSARLLSGVIKIGYSSASAFGQHGFHSIGYCSFKTAAVNFLDQEEVGFLLIFYRLSARLLGTVFAFLPWFCQGFSNHLSPLAVRLDELETSLIYNRLDISHSKLNGLSFWVFMLFGSWQITRNATKWETVALKRTDL